MKTIGWKKAYIYGGGLSQTSKKKPRVILSSAVFIAKDLYVKDTSGYCPPFIASLSFLVMKSGYKYSSYI